MRIVQLLAPEKVSPDDVAAMKSKLFGYKTFFMTGQEPFGEAGEGVLIRGNLRGKKEEVYEKLRSGMQDMFGEKYEMLMIDEPPLPGSDPGLGAPEGVEAGGGASRRVSFVVFRSEITQMPPTPAWQYLVAILLAAITGGCCLELGLVAQVRDGDGREPNSKFLSRAMLQSRLSTATRSETPRQGSQSLQLSASCPSLTRNRSSSATFLTGNQQTMA